MAVKTQAPEPPLGVVNILVAGFETVNARLDLILLPLALDLFLWLGPHLSVKPIVSGVLEQMSAIFGQGASDPNLIRTFNELHDMLTDYGATFNLFSALSTAPLGLPSLMVARAPLGVPAGAPLVWSLANPFLYLLLTVGLSLAGVFLGTVYFSGIAQQVRDTRIDLARLWVQVWGDWLQILVVIGLGLVLMVMLGVPLLLLAGLLTLISPLVSSLFTLLGSMVGLWMFIYLGFTLHGIVLQRRNLFAAMWDSVRLVHRNLSAAASLFAVVMLTSTGLSFVWNAPTDGSWLLLIGLSGHALVSTALVAATFKFYQDRYRWQQEMSQWTAAQSQRTKVNRR